MKLVVVTIASLTLYSFIGCSKNELKGTVVDGNNKTPIKGVTVTLEGTSFITLTDSNGQYYLSDFPDGDYYLKFSKEEFESKSLLVSLKQENELKNNVEMFLDRPTDIQVQDFVKNTFKSTSEKKYSNVKILNQWSDKDNKGFYYIMVSFDYDRFYFGKQALSSVQIWAFTKQGKDWKVVESPIKADWSRR
jgi:hypothetical protein